MIKDDPADNKFLEAAISADVNLIVSGDSHLLRLINFQGIKIMTPKDFCKQITKNP